MTAILVEDALKRRAPATGDPHVAFHDELERARFFGFLHMLYHLQHSSTLYCPARSGSCRFCAEFVRPGARAVPAQRAVRSRGLAVEAECRDAERLVT